MIVETLIRRCALPGQRYNEAMSKQETECECGNQACAVRIGRGLVPFCRMPAPSPQKRPGWSSYTEACAANPGKRVGLISGGLYTGSAARFGVRS